MATKSAYVDNQGRKITATAYQAQKDAGQDVSGYKPIQAKPAEASPTTATSVLEANLTDPMALETPQNTTGVVDTSSQQNNTSNIPQNNIKGSQKNDVISTPTEVKTNKVETPKETGPSKEDTSAQRLTEIQTNLQNYANNPNFQQYFKTQDAFNNYFGREQRTPEQQKVLDSFYTGYKVKQDKMVADNARYLTLSTMSDADLQNVNDINDISLISGDPNLKARYDAAQKNKQIMEFVYGKDYNKTDTTPDGIDGIAGNYSEEYSKAASELTATKSEMDKIQDTMDSTYDNLVKQYEGTGETDSYIRAKAAKLNSELTNQYNDLARKYNTQLGTVTALQATEDRKKEEQATNIALANQKMQMYNFLYGTPSAQKEEIPIQTKDFGTTKKPDWRQSLDGGKTRQPIEGISGGSTAGGGTGMGGIARAESIAATSAGDAIDILQNTSFSERKIAALGGIGGFISPRVQSIRSNYDYIKKNLMLGDFVKLKQSGATFGAMSNEERNAIQAAATKLNYNLSDSERNKELGVIRQKMGAAASRAGVPTDGTIQDMASGTPTIPTTKRQATLNTLKSEFSSQGYMTPAMSTPVNNTEKKKTKIGTRLEKIF